MEQQKARFQASVHTFTEMCFEKCVRKRSLLRVLFGLGTLTNPSSSLSLYLSAKPGNKLDKSEEACLAYCVDRFLDMSTLFVGRLQQSQGRM